MPIITVEENANGSGATVTVASSDPAASNAVEVSPADRNSFASAGTSRTGNGAVQAPVSAMNLTHAWRVRVRSTLLGVDTLSNAVVVTPTLGYGGVHFRAICAVQRALIAANILGIGGRVYRCEHPEFAVTGLVQTFPAILVHPMDAETRTPKTNAHTDWVYPVTVGIADRDDDYYRDLETHLHQRQQAIDYFDRRVLGMLAAEIKARRVSVQTRPVIDPESPKYQFYYSTIRLDIEVMRNIGG